MSSMIKDEPIRSVTVDGRPVFYRKVCDLIIQSGCLIQWNFSKREELIESLWWAWGYDGRCIQLKAPHCVQLTTDYSTFCLLQASSALEACQ